MGGSSSRHATACRRHDDDQGGNKKENLHEQHALRRRQLPASIVIVGAGAIGMEFAYVLRNYGVEVTIFEFLGRALIAVSPAINWLQQGRYNLLAELRADGASAARTKAEVAKSDTTLRLLERQATFEEYVKAMRGDADGMTADRWGFISKNYTADATQDLRALRGVPVLLTLAGHDINVDTADTERTYHKVLDAGGALTVKHYPDATHSLLKQSVEQSDLKVTLTALFSPHSLFADGFLDSQRQFLKELGRVSHATP
ncbi:FAD-dependent oxidoreductase (plasmid) [Streptomyces sp. NBC_01369]|uniref:FAD-dependent oxidoreductase n=1 Tax=unclassified Streptomyces TaxID=2593676 RepID=UPI0022567E8E|nr:FAD-dependent oxidoreductase [Streptomyces sp. NBC_00892]MCX4902429.1 FAD-dependent oxidoreductase [Streptomyces sp. NBC_00892]